MPAVVLFRGLTLIPAWIINYKCWKKLLIHSIVEPESKFIVGAKGSILCNEFENVTATHLPGPSDLTNFD